MVKIKRNEYFLQIILFILIAIISESCFALDQNEKLWFGVNSRQTLSKDKKWMSSIYAQLRFINKSHPLQVAILEGGIGYRFIDNGTIWVGYRWSGHNPNNRFHQLNRLFQQIILEKKLINSNRFIFRTRLEEVERNDRSQLSIRLRQRIAFELRHSCFSKILPYFYDEVFFQLKNTDYTSNKLINENRIFIGFNLYTADKTSWEIGYINQFLMRTPQQSQNTMNHIISFTYNLS